MNSRHAYQINRTGAVTPFALKLLETMDVFMYYNNHLMPCNAHHPSLGKQVTIHQPITMLATSINVLFPGHNHLLTTGVDDPSLTGARVINKVSGHQY